MRNFPLSTLYMGQDTDSLKNEPAALALSWSRGLSLKSRILAVNLFVVALIIGGLFFLDSYRSRLTDDAMRDAGNEAQLLALSLPMFDARERRDYLLRFTAVNDSRVRLYGDSGEKLFDSFAIAPPTYTLQNPKTEPIEKKAAKLLDKIFDVLVFAPRLDTFKEPAADTAAAWPELTQQANPRRVTPATDVRLAPDATHMISAGIPAINGNYSILLTKNAREIRLFVRAERFKVAMFFLLVLGIAVLLSLFLARTIVRPIKHLSRAAVKVRLGRAQEVHVPRIPSRRDEIGLLARALSDMSVALRDRIYATEAFAADVAHEGRSRHASLRSALDGMDNVKDDKLRAQLMDVAKADVKRMDRLISDISEASRVDAQLAKTSFEEIDLGDMIEQLLQARERRGEPLHNDQPDDGAWGGEQRGVRIAFARPRRGVAVIMGEDIRMERVLTNLIDNAVSFSPDNGLVEILATRDNGMVIVRVIDEGPGVPESEREHIFRRFHSSRPEREQFGEHSGLGLAIARTITVGHRGEISVSDREDGQSGACFEISLPSAESLSE